jgi:hypothetical protein
LLVVGIVLARDYQTEDYSCACLIISVVAIVTCLVVIPAGSISSQQSTNEFNQQTQYLSTHIVESDIENAALTTKKIELNTWLYNAKWSNNKFGIFSFYPDSIQELEPIQ